MVYILEEKAEKIGMQIKIVRQKSYNRITTKRDKTPGNGVSKDVRETYTDIGNRVNKARYAFNTLLTKLMEIEVSLFPKQDTNFQYKREFSHVAQTWRLA